ncbi:HAD-superfamily hydrolase, subfamily IA, variant 1 [Pseudooceanicola batsensis HTCC2597]|uniref:HAD-superfamily hydrolase, subfamily IA, variant 1 n=1 Tax=Pseudooceanicola batsensis (strain ATCC BAA-863 / DSM 15984 / KCTC 12145 / HTCC2597) TaxID=252305 RepID=A3TU38_PSEBH|nr:HAD-IA family hydrolase [Pseudooceanicola batsensis]EAQ05165.1 HAD-superfamily hydrolase, subfamily IA, variant 1 [Pseudooceanicola batsensis HTCC2597]
MRLVIFDVDGTLVDSQGDIVASMTAAFDFAGLAPPDRAAVLAIVGLSLDRAMFRLSPEVPPEQRDAMVARYKEAYHDLRVQAGAASSPLYPGVAEVLAEIRAEPDMMMAVATGKSRRGLTALMDNHGWTDVFDSVQVADDHPSKPHPSMILTALAETGVAPERAVMIGDTTFDMEMAGAARIAFIGVSWGYHPPQQLTQAREIVAVAQDLPAAVDRAIGVSA